MIIPLTGLQYYQFDALKINDELLLVKEKDNLYEDKAIGAYNHLGQQVGYISARSSYNVKVYNKITKNNCIGKVWCISNNQALIELDFQS